MSDAMKVVKEILDYCSMNPFKTLFFKPFKENKEKIVEKFMSVDNSVSSILLGKMTDNIPEELIGTYGMGNMDYLKGLLNHPSFKGEDAEFFIKQEESEEYGKYPFLLKLTNKEGSCAIYRFIPPKIADDNFISIKEQQWDYEFAIKENKVKELESFVNVTSTIGDFFRAEIKDDKLFFVFGENNAMVEIMFSSESKVSNNPYVDVKIPGGWKAKTVLPFFKVVSKQSEPKVSFSKKGTICLSMKTEHMELNYIFLSQMT